MVLGKLRDLPKMKHCVAFRAMNRFFSFQYEIGFKAYSRVYSASLLLDLLNSRARNCDGVFFLYYEQE